MTALKEKTGTMQEGLFDWMDPDLKGPAESALMSKMPRGRNPLGFRTPVRDLDRRIVDGKRHVIFVSYYPAPAFEKRAWPSETAANTILP